MKLKKDDKVIVISGKDKGKTGKVMKVYPDKNSVLVEGVNVYKKHRRPKKQGEKGEVISVNRPMSAAKVMYVCGNCGKSVRLGYKIEGDKKTRACRKCGSAA